MTCCPHRELSHRYDTAARRNIGPCLVAGCGCAGGGLMGEKCLGMGGLSVGAWDNGATNTDGPARCANTVIRGALPTGLESTNG